MTEQGLEIRRLVGMDLKNQINDLAALRITVFRDFPYLYEGSLDYEEKYLEIYLKSPRCAVIAVFDHDKLVGAASALPLVDEADYVQQPFLEAGYNLEEIFYFGESVLLPKYRGLGIGHHFFNHREAVALSFPEFKKACFCAVERPLSHSRRPINYRPLDEFWEKRGYKIQPQLKAKFSWQDLDEEQESEKSMIFWMRDLR